LGEIRPFLIELLQRSLGVIPRPEVVNLAPDPLRPPAGVVGLQGIINAGLSGLVLYAGNARLGHGIASCIKAPTVSDTRRLKRRVSLLTR